MKVGVAEQDLVRVSASPDLPFVTVVVPFRNAEECLERCLDSLLAMDYPSERMEFLLVDGMSEDRGRSIAERYARERPGVRVLANPARSSPAALNVGVANALGEIVVHAIAHALYPPEYVATCVRELLAREANGVGNVGGRMVAVPRTPSSLGWAIVAAYQSPFGTGGTRYRRAAARGEPRPSDAVAFFCVRRELLQRAGPFDERLRRADDVYLRWRLRELGYQTLLVPSVAVHYLARSDLSSFAKHAFSNGMWNVLPLKYVPNPLVSPRHLVPLAFVAALVMLGALSLADARYVAPLSALVGAYLVLALVFSVPIAIEHGDPRYLLTMPVVFAMLHLCYGLGSLWGLVRLVLPERSRRR